MTILIGDNHGDLEDGRQRKGGAREGKEEAQGTSYDPVAASGARIRGGSGDGYQPGAAKQSFFYAKGPTELTGITGR
jgi:hypothetical protein